MDIFVYKSIEQYMLSCMGDSAHDKDHVYRVLYSALEIAEYESNVNIDVLIAACLLHDIGRRAQFADPLICHAAKGGEMAYEYLLGIGWSALDSEHVRNCILTHRFRGGEAPRSIEAKILFDSDKLDVTGAVGVARTLMYNGQASEPLYSLDASGNLLDGSDDMEPSFFQEYKFKLEKLYELFYTKRAREIAWQRKSAAESFYFSVLSEVKSCYENGKNTLSRHLY